MATARTVQLTPENTGLWGIKQTEAAAKVASELLQKDIEKHHCFFNNKGFHNHISHQLLALYGIGASPEELQQGYDDNESYQKRQFEVHADEIEALKDFEKAKEKLGKEEFYTDFLAFFQNEIDEKGWKEVVNEYLFKGDERSDDLLVRTLGGFIHPIIQLMYGIEWEQPAIVAMGLAQAAVHDDDLRQFMLASEEAAKKSNEPTPKISDLLQEVAANKKLATAVRVSDGNKMASLLKNALDDAVAVAAKVRVAPEELEARTVEMYNTAVYQATGAALHPGKEPRYDFFLMHHVNLCPLFPSLNAKDWISTAAKVRLIEWKIRFDVVGYAARSCPPLSLERITAYQPHETSLKPTAELLPRIRARPDDGHVSKLIRAVGGCQIVSKKYEDKDWLMIKGDDLWTKINQLVVDSVETAGPTWIRLGNEDPWAAVPDRQDKK